MVIGEVCVNNVVKQKRSHDFPLSLLSASGQEVELYAPAEFENNGSSGSKSPCTIPGQNAVFGPGTRARHSPVSSSADDVCVVYRRCQPGLYTVSCDFFPSKVGFYDDSLQRWVVGLCACCWSSASGWLREAPQFCRPFRGKCQVGWSSQYGNRGCKTARPSRARWFDDGPHGAGENGGGIPKCPNL